MKIVVHYKQLKQSLQEAEVILRQISDKSNPTYLKRLVNEYFKNKNKNK